MVSRAARPLSAVLGVAAASFWLAAGPAAEAQAPIRIGATLSRTGVYASSGQNQLPGYQLCVKHINDTGGVLGRKLELIVHDDASDPATSVRLYGKLITQGKVDLVLGPFGAPIVDAVADLAEKHRMPMVAPVGGPSAMYRKGRKFVFSAYPPTENLLEGLMGLAARKGLKTVALVSWDRIGERAVAQGTVELARKNALQVVLGDTVSAGTTDFSAILTRVREVNPDVLGVIIGSVEAGVAIARQMKALDVNPRMVGMTPGASPPRFREILGRDAEFFYMATDWVPELVEVRAGGLIPIARQYPGAREFVEASRKEAPGAASNAYGACQVLVEGVKRAGSVDGARVREAISRMDYHTVFGRFRVDQDGVQIGHRMLLFQWQDGRRAIVWPEELAPDKPRFPTPPWGQRP